MGMIFALCLAAAFLLAGLPAWGQETTASITGTVSDPSGGAVANATVTAKDVDRGTTFTAKTNASGLYSIPRIPVGNYTLKVEAAGFQTSEFPVFTLVLNQVARVDATLKVGTVSQVVEVTAAAPVLQTQTTEVSTIVDSATNDNLPLATRNPTQLTLLAPGAVSVDVASFNLGSNTAEGGGRPYINGNREQANNFLLDGVDNNQVSENILGLTPSPDAIQEFNLITQNAPAEFGNFEGGVVNTTIKSGTNHFHGDAFEFFRNNVLNANQWVNGLTGFPTPAMRWNMFGATLGGPILKNKLFFFIDYQGGRFDFPSTSGNITVLSNDERQGNFGELLSLAQPIQLYNPCQAGTGVSGSPCVLVAQSARQTFGGNIIPTNMLDPIFTKLTSSSLYPTATSLSGNGFAYATNVTGQQYNTDQGDLKLDWVLTDKDRISFRYSQGYQFDPASNSVALLGSTVNLAHLYNYTGQWTHSLSPSLINEFRFGVNRITFTNGATTFPSSVGNLGTTLGINDANPNGVAGLLELAFAGGTITDINTSTPTALGSALVVENFGSTVVQFDDGLIINHGAHTFKVGFQLNRYRIDAFYSGNGGELGAILYSGAYTQGPTPSVPNQGGNGSADFALGLPGYVGRGVSAGSGWHQRDWLIAGYAQDDWRATSNLTFNLGVRYEARTPWIETNNQQSNVNILTGEVELAGVDGNSRGLYSSTYGWPDIQPRLGFAWTPRALGDNTVIRGAYTVSSYLEGTGTNLRLTQNPPFTPAQSEGSNTFATGDTPFTTAAGSIAASSPPGGNPYQDATMLAWYGTVQPAIAQQWNLSIQRQLANNTTLQIGYVGQKGTHMMVPQWLSQGILQPDGTVLPTPYLGGQFAPGLNPNCPTDTNTTYGPNCFGAVKDTVSDGKMNYNALQAVLQKRFSQGLEGQVAYTYSKCMTNSSGYYGTWSDTTQTTPASPYWQNLYNPNAEWSQCYYDVKHMISAYAVYELPYGHGKRYGNDASAVMNQALGGWSVNPIVSWHTGMPFALYSPSDTSGTGSQGARPNCNGYPIYEKTVNVASQGLQWVSPATFSVPVAGTFGNCPAQGPVIGPGYSDWDISLQKNFTLGETRRLQFRADFLNAFNHPNFSKMDNTVTDTNFGLITDTQSPRNIQFALKFYF